MIDVEQGTFTSLVLTGAGGMARQSQIFLLIIKFPQYRFRIRLGEKALSPLLCKKIEI